MSKRKRKRSLKFDYDVTDYVVAIRFTLPTVKTEARRRALEEVLDLFLTASKPGENRPPLSADTVLDALETLRVCGVLKGPAMNETIRRNFKMAALCKALMESES